MNTFKRHSKIRYTNVTYVSNIKLPSNHWLLHTYQIWLHGDHDIHSIIVNIFGSVGGDCKFQMMHAVHISSHMYVNIYVSGNMRTYMYKIYETVGWIAPPSCDIYLPTHYYNIYGEGLSLAIWYHLTYWKLLIPKPTAKVTHPTADSRTNGRAICNIT